MKISKRILLIFLILIMLVFLVLIFWPVLFANILYPLAGAVWILLRILVLSVDQKIYWGLLVFGLVLYSIWILFQESPSDEIEEEHDPEITPFQEIEYWESMFSMDLDEGTELYFIKRELTHLVTSLFVGAERKKANYIILEELKEKKIPLPQNIYLYLFKEETDPETGSFKIKIKKFRQTVTEWAGSWQSNKAKHIQNVKKIDEVLTFLETTLEIKHEDK